MTTIVQRQRRDATANDWMGARTVARALRRTAAIAPAITDRRVGRNDPVPAHVRPQHRTSVRLVEVQIPKLGRGDRRGRRRRCRRDPGGRTWRMSRHPAFVSVLREVREQVGSFDLSFLAGLPLDEARSWLTALNGVGPKTASCVLLFSLDRPAMPVDTHVHRVSLRLGLIPERTSAERAHALLEAIVPDGEAYAAHMLMIRHGRETCVARRPKCAACVLVQCCPAAPTFLGGEQEQDGDQAY